MIIEREKQSSVKGSINIRKTPSMDFNVKEIIEEPVVSDYNYTASEDQ